MIASEVGLGVRASKQYIFFLILSPVAPTSSRASDR